MTAALWLLFGGLIAGLSDPDWSARDAATKGLKRAGWRAAPALVLVAPADREGELRRDALLWHLFHPWWTQPRVPGVCDDDH